MHVRPPLTTVLLPLDPEASTVKRTMVRAYSEGLCISGRFERARGQTPKECIFNNLLDNNISDSSSLGDGV
jgi:hypothetical protein